MASIPSTSSRGVVWGVSGGGEAGRRGVAWRFDISSIKQLSSFDRISFPQNSSL